MYELKNEAVSVLRASALKIASARCACKDCKAMLAGDAQTERPKLWEFHVLDLMTHDDFALAAQLLLTEAIEKAVRKLTR